MGVKMYSVILCICLPLLVNCNLGFDFPDKSVKSDFELIFQDSANYSNYKLPTNLKPTSYELYIIPFLKNSTFNGKVLIDLVVMNATNLIAINTRFETILNSSINAYVKWSKPPVNIINTTFDQEHQMIWFQLNDTLPPQTDPTLTISIDYKGRLATDMLGFYLSTYNTTDEYGGQTEHQMAITQFEPTYARRAFPCFDEPAYRANFTIHIYRPANHTTLSNMNLFTSVYDKALDMFVDTYATTPLMPTYLVAFGVSTLANMSDGGNLRVFTRPDVIQDAAFTLSIGQKILDSIGNYVNYKYPLPKMDVVSVPDFSEGAMENWGLTTYSEKFVLYNQKKNTYKDKFGVLSVLAHEFGHQWFGDLVTPQWWTYTWLKEAFATYFEYVIPDQMFPEWNMGSTMYVVEALQYALDVDTDITIPMTFPVNTPDQIKNMFNYVNYQKGGSILRMIENFLTTPIWKSGLNTYLTQNAYKTGTPEKLFSALEAAAYAWNSSVAPRVVSTLTTWTIQPGYPLVKIHKEQGPMYLITQSPYELTNNTDQRWSIPLTFTTQELAQFDPTKASRTLLYATGDTMAINTSGWLIFNIGQVGYYRVNYEKDNWAKLTQQLKTNYSVIGTINRAQLIDDAFHLAKSGHLNYSTVFALTSYLPQEKSFAPWNAYITNMRYLINQFYNTSVGEELMQYARGIMASPFQTLTANLTNSSSTFLGSLTLMTAGKFSCEIQLPECESLALAAFESWQKNPYGLLPETKEAVICTKLRLDSSGKSFQTVLDYFLNSDNGAEQVTLFKAMGCVTNERTIEMYLNVICDISANHVRLQNRPHAFSALLSFQTGVIPGLLYIVNNYDKVNEALGSEIDLLFVTMGETISQAAHIIQVLNIAKDTKVDQGLRYKLRTLVLPQVLKRHFWAQSAKATELNNWLDNYLGSSAPSLLGQFMLILPLVSFLILRL